MDDGSWKTFATNLAGTSQTTVYTCPANTWALVTWVNVCDDAGAARTITLEWTDDSASATYALVYQESMPANGHFEFPQENRGPLVLEPSDTLKATGSAAGMHVVVTVREIGRRNR